MKRLRRLAHVFIAHKGNRYRPTLFAKGTVAALALVIIVIEGAYLVQTKLVYRNTGFLATVLPAALTTLANADRAAQGVSALVEDPALGRIAQAKANDMAAKGYFAHVSPEGKTPWYWLEQAGYEYTYAGENLAVDFTDSEDVEEAWMNSPAHRANLLKQEYTRVGIAVAQGRYQGREATFVAQFFATPPEEEVSVPAGIAAALPKDAASISANMPAESAAPQVLGEQSAAPKSSAVSGALAVASTSPNHTVWYLLAGFAAVIAVFYVLALTVHVRKKMLHRELVIGGLILILLCVWVLMYNGTAGANVPHDSQSAAASAYF